MRDAFPQRCQKCWDGNQFELVNPNGLGKLSLGFWDIWG
jgi:hypothetical protein